jgi:uncharacterized protein YwgA
MNDLKQSAIVLSLIEQLRNRGSWCGETHVQKATYFLQELMGLPLNFDFILYKYGPYSFDLNDELVAMRANTLIRLFLNPPYGPTLEPGEATEQVKSQFPQTLKKFKDQIAFVADKLSQKKVSELEALSTALYVRLNECNNLSPNHHAKLLRELKPHINERSALEAVTELNNVISESQRFQALRAKT